MRRSICFFGVVIQVCLCVFGADAPDRKNAASGFGSGAGAGKPLFFSLDVSGARGIEEIFSDSGTAEFSLLTSSLPSFGFTRDSVWLRLDLESDEDAERTLLFSLRTARLREVDWYLVQDQQVIEHRAEGIDRPPYDGFRGRYPAFLVELPAGEPSALYVRVRSDSSIWLPLYWAPLRDMLEMEMRWNFFEQAFLGFGFAMVIISILVSLAHPAKGFVRLAGISFCFLGYHLLFHGYLDWWIPGLPAWFHRHLLLVCAAGSSLFMLLFTQSYFMDDEISPFSRRLLVYSPPACLVFVLVLSALPFRTAAHFTLLLNLWAYGFGLLLSGRMLMRHRTLSNLFFTLAWFFTALTIVAFGVQIHLPISGPLHPLKITRMLIPMMYLFFLAANLRRQYSLREERENTLKARQAAVRANLDALRYQLNPHFLFNALNTIDALSRLAPEKISGVVLKLATFLRLRLKPARDGLLPLSEEMIICRSYLDIEKIRFEERLQVVWRIDDRCEQLLVPEMILQPLIENAVKYGLKQNETLHVLVSAEMNDGRMCLSVRNNGRLVGGSGMKPSETGVGLENVQKRLRFLYGTQGMFSLKEETGWVIATVMIPAKKAPDESYSVFDY